MVAKELGFRVGNSSNIIQSTHAFHKKMFLNKKPRLAIVAFGP